MSILIHYSGKLRTPFDLPALIAEVSDLCQSLDWKYDYIAPQPDTPLEGLVIHLEKCDPVWFTFLPEGSLFHPLLYQCIKGVEKTDHFEAGQAWIGAPTYHAGADAHMQLIKLLRFLGNKYFERFELNDDSEFWETNNEKLCRDRFAKLKTIEADGRRVKRNLRRKF